MACNLTVAEIAQKLADQAESICMKLLPHGKRHGSLWEAGDISGDAGKSLKVQLSGKFAGHWKDWSNDDDRGDLLDLWERVRGISRIEALKAAKAHLGIVEMTSFAQKTYSRPSNPKVKDIAPAGIVMKYLTTERKLTAETVQKFRVKGDGENIVFPCYAPDGEWLNNSFRGIKAGPDGKKTVFQEKGCAPCVFGWHALDKAAFDARTILLCEGQIDAMTWTQWGIPALSIPNGSGRTWIEFEWENLSAFDTIHLSFDMDGKSDNNLAEVVERLGRHRCRIVKMPHKDANDALKAGASAQEAASWVAESKFRDLPALVSGTDLYDRIWAEFNPTKEKIGIAVPEFSSTFPPVTFRFRPAELTVWGGESFGGKSTLLGWLFGNLAVLHDQRCGIWSFEVKPEKTFKKIITSLIGGDGVTKADLEGWQSVAAFKFVAYDRVGSISETELLETLAYARARYGVTHAMIDSLMRVQGLEENYPAQGEFMNRLTELARRTGVHIHLVAHTRKNRMGDAPNANDIKGSSLIRNNCDNLILVHRNMKKADAVRAGEMTPLEAAAEPDVTLLLDKDREEGEYARFDLIFDRKRQSYDKFNPPPGAPKYSTKSQKPKKQYRAAYTDN